MSINSVWNQAQLDKAFAIEANNIVVKTTGGTLYSVQGYNDSSSTQYIQVFDATETGKNIVATHEVEAKTNFSIDFHNRGIIMNTGIVVANSSTAFTPTLGAEDTSFIVVYN